MEIKNCFYRVSVKALVLNETRDKFLICKEEDGTWELPGGGLDWGSAPQEDLVREIDEEMGVGVIWVAEHPSYFITGQTLNLKIWVVNVMYEAKLSSLDFKASDECVEIRFVNKEDIHELDVFPTVRKLSEMFNPELHRKE